MQFFQTPNIDFISKRKTAYVVSSGLIALGFVSLFFRGGLNLGIDFKGGTSVVLQFKQDEMTVGDLRSIIIGELQHGAEIKSFGASNDSVQYLVYVEQQKDMSADDMAESLKAHIKQTLPDVGFHEIGRDSVGPKIGQELRSSAVWAILLALLMILIYIGIRFELIFAIGAIVALFHDVVITLGIFNLLGFELSLKEIAAFLTIVGYSLNDTIVVYDRVRENLKVMRNEKLGVILNASINQCLSRTIVTSMTTFLVVLILFLRGGSVIQGFAFAMLIGVVIGTYSSIFVASPVILEWQSRHGGKNRLKMAKKKK